MRIQNTSRPICYAVCWFITGLSPILFGEESSLPVTIDNTSISITDIEGNEHYPFKLEDKKGAVLFFVTHDCPISNAYSPELARLREDYETKDFNLLLVHVDPDVTNEEIQQHVKDYSLSGYTVVSDKTHTLVRETGATITPEAVVILPDGTIPYRGRIDNMYPALGQRRKVISQKDLRNALNSIIENKPIQVPRTKAVGCYIPNL